MDPEDAVVLVDAAGRQIGTHPRETVHHAHTPRHLAFSCWLQRPDGALLITRRALTKTTWPGVWTNACCGHPRPGEAIADAVLRRVAEELGLQPTAVECRLPDFSYRAVDAGGRVENELCPVFVGRIEAVTIVPDPDEVADWIWTDAAALTAAMTAAPYAFSPWAVEQARLLTASPADRHGDRTWSL